MRHPLLGVCQALLRRRQFRLQFTESGPQGSPEFIVVLFEDSLRCLRHLLPQPLDPSEQFRADRLVGLRRSLLHRADTGRDGRPQLVLARRPPH
jgi:hypothetical protein